MKTLRIPYDELPRGKYDPFRASDDPEEVRTAVSPGLVSYGDRCGIDFDSYEVVVVESIHTDHAVCVKNDHGPRSDFHEGYDS